MEEELGARGGPEAARGQGAAPRNNWKMSEQGHSLPQLRLLLLGKHGAGKSATGNAILGKPVFKSKLSEKQMITTECQTESGIVEGTEVVVIDTPDLFSSNVSAEDKSLQLNRCVELSAPSLHALLLIIPIGHFKKEDEETMEAIEYRFGPESRKHSIIVFTRKDDLGADSLQDYIEENESLKVLVQECGLRYCALNNKAPKEEQDIQVSELICKITHLVQENKGPYCLRLKNDSGLQDTCKKCTIIERCDNSHDTLSIILVGRSGAGKSATGNTILRSRDFPSQLSPQSVTKTCQSRKTNLWGQDVVVVDTPSLLVIPSDSESPSQVEKEVESCWQLCEGNILFVLVFQLGRFTQMEQNVLVQLETIFGKDVKKYTIVLFTRKEDLEGGDIEDYIKGIACKALGKTVEACGRQVCAFNNRESGEAREDQVKSFLEKANDLIKDCGGHGYLFNWDDISRRMKHAQKKHKAKNQNLGTRILSQGLKYYTEFKSGFEKDAKEV